MSVINSWSINNCSREWRGGEEGRVDNEPIRMSLCRARVSITLIRCQSVSSDPTWREGAREGGREGRRGGGRKGRKEDGREGEGISKIGNITHFSCCSYSLYIP